MIAQLFLAAATLCCPTPPHDIAVGDSILWGPAALISHPPLTVDAVIGRDIDVSPYGGDTLREAVAAAIPQVDAGGWLIVEDDVGGVTRWQYRMFVRSVVEQLPDDRCLAWVAPFSIWREEVSWQIRTELADQPCHRVIRWRAAVETDRTLLNVDGLHPSETGVAVLAGLIEAAIS